MSKFGQPAAWLLCPLRLNTIKYRNVFFKLSYRIFLFRSPINWDSDNFSHALITSYDKDLEAQVLNVSSLEAKKYQHAPTVVINNFFFNCLTVSYTNEPFFRSNG